MNNSKLSLSTSWVHNSQVSVITQNVKDSGNKFQLGSTNNIAGWEFDHKKLTKRVNGARDTGIELSSEEGILSHGDELHSISTFAGMFTFKEGASSAYSGSGVEIDTQGDAPLGGPGGGQGTDDPGGG